MTKDKSKGHNGMFEGDSLAVPYINDVVAINLHLPSKCPFINLLNMIHSLYYIIIVT